MKLSIKKGETHDNNFIHVAMVLTQPASDFAGVLALAKRE